MSDNLLSNSIDFLKGLGPVKADLLRKELGIFTLGDLLSHFPIRYIDRTQFFKIKDLKQDLLSAQVKGRLTQMKEEGIGRKTRLKAYFQDDTGGVELVWFAGIKWIKGSLKIGGEYVLFGKPASFNNKITFSHPELTPLLDFVNQNQAKLQAVYPSTEKLKKRGLDSKGFIKLLRTLFFQIGEQNIPENLPSKLRVAYQLIDRWEAFKQIHFPVRQSEVKWAQYRLKFEELFFLQLKILRAKSQTAKAVKGPVFAEVGIQFNRFYQEHLPFELTGAQKRVLREIRRDTATGLQMNRLIQGDVGSGKTLVALMSLLLAVDNGFQGALMAPTEILAQQHFETISTFVQHLDLRVALLTGSTKKAERAAIDEGLREGTISILIGTHALIEDKVVFQKLGLAVIDEQHRFGVAQRYKLWKKGQLAPHILVMTATPIPRTVAMTVYGDLDTSIIDELPPGRKPISTKHFFDNQRLAVLGFMKEQIKLGRQIYVVYPLIEESEAMDYKDLMDGYESLSRYFPIPEYQISVVHGRMKPEDKAFEMKRFEEGKTQIMVATTVIEVGVNVPNASVMVIESAERFGLSQLHQLRGRVGRGSNQSYCILMTGSKLGKEAKTRMNTMVGTTDGFKIAEVDLKLRGPGDIAGTRQSGLLDLKLASLVEDSGIIAVVRQEAKQLLEEDPELEVGDNRLLLTHLKSLQDHQINWGRIS